MTPTDIDKMTDLQIAEAVARAMGWKFKDVRIIGFWADSDGDLQCYDFLPCTDAGHAMLAIDYVLDKHADLFSVSKDDGEYQVEFCIPDNEWSGHTVSKNNPSYGRAVCEAVLDALSESEVGGGKDV